MIGAPQQSCLMTLLVSLLLTSSNVCLVYFWRVKLLDKLLPKNNRKSVTEK